MKVIEIRVEQLRNTGNYENEKIGVTVALNEGDSVDEAVQRARRFIGAQLYQDRSIRERMERTVKNPDDYTGAQVKAAQQWLDDNPLEGMEF